MFLRQLFEKNDRSVIENREKMTDRSFKNVNQKLPVMTRSFFWDFLTFRGHDRWSFETSKKPLVMIAVIFGVPRS